MRYIRFRHASDDDDHAPRDVQYVHSVREGERQRQAVAQQQRASAVVRHRALPTDGPPRADEYGTRARQPYLTREEAARQGRASQSQPRPASAVVRRVADDSPVAYPGEPAYRADGPNAAARDDARAAWPGDADYNARTDAPDPRDTPAYPGESAYSATEADPARRADARDRQADPAADPGARAWPREPAESDPAHRAAVRDRQEASARPAEPPRFALPRQDEGGPSYRRYRDQAAALRADAPEAAHPSADGRATAHLAAYGASDGLAREGGAAYDRPEAPRADAPAGSRNGSSGAYDAAVSDLSADPRAAAETLPGNPSRPAASPRADAARAPFAPTVPVYEDGAGGAFIAPATPEVPEWYRVAHQNAPLDSRRAAAPRVQRAPAVEGDEDDALYPDAVYDGLTEQERAALRRESQPNGKPFFLREQERAARAGQPGGYAPHKPKGWGEPVASGTRQRPAEPATAYERMHARAADARTAAAPTAADPRASRAYDAAARIHDAPLAVSPIYDAPPAAPGASPSYDAPAPASRATRAYDAPPAARDAAGYAMSPAARDAARYGAAQASASESSALSARDGAGYRAARRSAAPAGAPYATPRVDPYADASSADSYAAPAGNLYADPHTAAPYAAASTAAPYAATEAPARYPARPRASADGGEAPYARRAPRAGREPDPDAPDETAARPGFPWLGIAAGFLCVAAVVLWLVGMGFGRQAKALQTERETAAQKLEDKYRVTLVEDGETTATSRFDKYRALVEREAEANNLHPAFVSAIIYNESTFRPDAESSVGARGLMQMMEQTAEWVAGKIGFTSGYSFDLMYDPATNVKFACWYLANLSELFDGDPVLVASAFHAGQNEVKNWLANSSISPDGRTIDLSRMPDGPTKQYATRVLNAYAAYKRLFYEATR